jgi:hypothetical protein
MWSMRERKKSSVAGQANIEKLPEKGLRGLLNREKLYLRNQEIYNKINGLRINQGRLLTVVRVAAVAVAQMEGKASEGPYLLCLKTKKPPITPASS